jgi:hypothetical protein
MANTINEYFQPSSTSSHSNIDNLILEAELDKFAQTGSIREDKTPRYIGGTDDVVANIALSPILTLKSMGNFGRKILEKTGLRNPVSHYTHSNRIVDILDEGRIKGKAESFPGKPFYKDSRQYLDRLLDKDETGWLSETSLKFMEQYPKSPSVSITRDPMFLSRPHGHVGSDIGLIMDRDQLVSQGMKIQPFAEKGFQKTYQTLRELNPKFEFEERIRGYIPSKNIKLIDLLNFPQGAGKRFEAYDIINTLGKTDIPIIRNPKTTEQIETMAKMFSKYGMERMPSSVIEERLNNLLSTPTYKFDPFKR